MKIAKIGQIFLIFALLLTLALQFEARAQDVILPTVTVQFSVIVDPLSIALETWDSNNPPDSVKITAYKMASGFLAGIPFHFERNRNRLSVIEQVDKVSNTMRLTDVTEVEGCLKFDFIVEVPESVAKLAKSGESYKGHGISEEKNLALARENARKEALTEAVRAAITENYTRRNKLIPGVLDGRIAWYEITNEGRDPDSGDYIVDIEAWIPITVPSEQPTNGRS